MSASSATADASLWRVACEVEEEFAPVFEGALEPFVETVSWFATEGRDAGDGGLWRLEGICRTPPDRVGLELALELSAKAAGVAAPALLIERLGARDWLAENLRDFPPVRLGRFWVYGSHVKEPPPVGCVPLKIDAATAFGSGEHPTTQGCLLALDQLAKSIHPRRVLDVGCGSGILAMAAAKLWNVPALASDIDPIAAHMAQANARRNGTGALMRAVTATGYAHAAIKRRTPYDLIFANILARPLMRLAFDLSRHLAPGGVAILSGLLERQERMVLGPHRAQGLMLLGRVKRSGWATLIVGRRNSPY